MISFKDYNKEVLFEKIENISIEKVGSQVITKYHGKVIKVANVSNRYEIFDISKYLKSKIELIEKNFNITRYKFSVVGGVQYLQLISDKVEVGGVEFYKSFYILNSSDKSRRLSFNVGLYSEKSNFYVIDIKNTGLLKKHLKGVSKAAEEVSNTFSDSETFDEQIKSLKSIVGHKVLFSKVRDIILGDDANISKINHQKFDAFKNVIRYEVERKKETISKSYSKEIKSLLFTKSDKIGLIEKELDFYVDAFWAFRIYLRLFNKQDSHIIRNETKRIMKITQFSIRNSILESLGI
jgi:hypothetical protein